MDLDLDLDLDSDADITFGNPDLKHVVEYVRTTCEYCHGPGQVRDTFLYHGMAVTFDQCYKHGLNLYKAFLEKSLQFYSEGNGLEWEW